MYPYIIQGDNIVIVINNKPHTISKTFVTYEQILEAIKKDNAAAIDTLINPSKAITRYSNGHVKVLGEHLYWDNELMHNALSARIIRMLQDGFDMSPMIHFMHNLMQNPSKRAIDELYGFLEKAALPITPDGYFLAYKKIRDDYTDCHTGTLDNSVGSVVEMPRGKVDDNKEVHCSQGLHFCSLEYLSSFSGARTVIVKIHPADVVSIPSDYNLTKGRTCRYEVVDELAQHSNPSDAFQKSVQSGSYSLEDLFYYNSEFWTSDGSDDAPSEDYMDNTPEEDEEPEQINFRVPTTGYRDIIITYK